MISRSGLSKLRLNSFLNLVYVNIIIIVELRLHNNYPIFILIYLVYNRNIVDICIGSEVVGKFRVSEFPHKKMNLNKNTFINILG